MLVLCVYVFLFLYVCVDVRVPPHPPWGQIGPSFVIWVSFLLDFPKPESPKPQVFKTQGRRKSQGITIICSSINRGLNCFIISYEYVRRYFNVYYITYGVSRRDRICQLFKVATMFSTVSPMIISRNDET